MAPKEDKKTDTKADETKAAEGKVEGETATEETKTDAKPSVAAAAAPAKKSLPPLPTVEELEGMGASKAEALASLVRQMALRCRKPVEEADALATQVLSVMSAPVPDALKKSVEPYYRVVCTSPHGSFFRIKRRFGKEPTKVLKSSLTEAQIKELEESNPQFLSVVLIDRE